MSQDHNSLQVIPQYDSIGTNVNKTNLQEVEVVQMYQETPKAASTPLAVVTQAAANQEAPAVKEEVKEEAKTEGNRRDALKRLSDRERKLTESEKAVKEKLAKAEDFQKFYEQAKEDPRLIAKAFGMETGEFLKKMQHKVLDLKEEAPKPEVIAQQRIAQLEEQTKRLAETQAQAQKSAYVNQAILPILTKNAEKYPELSMNPEVYSSYIYDVINSHWRETGGEKGGEIWQADKVAEALEAQAQEDLKAKAEVLRKSPTAKKYFKEEVETVQIAPVRTISSSLGSNASGGLPTLPEKTSDGAKIVYTSSLDPREARRQKTAQAIKQQFPDRFTKTNKK